ncbi:MAG: DUF4440 domain-containing protein [Saprospirales bacterium]|nr:DUF4440 domain-containing protein [Saprospirales bacterium]MBK8491154.1 DUF4440 domain-containing protein [Saprospirales bacterium]
MKVKPHLFFTAIVGLFLSSCQTAAPPETPAPDLDQIRSELQVMEDAYAVAENAKDADAVMAYYAEDAVNLPNDEPPVMGKAAILARMKDKMASDTTEHSIRFEVVDVFAAGDLAVEVGKSIFTDAAGKEHMGKYISVFEKRDGKYVCIRDMWNDDADDDAEGGMDSDN